MTIQLKATEQFFPVILFTMLYKMVLSLNSEDEILKCDIQMKATEQSTFLCSCLFLDFITLFRVLLLAILHFRDAPFPGCHKMLLVFHGWCTISSRHRPLHEASSNLRRKTTGCFSLKHSLIFTVS